MSRGVRTCLLVLTAGLCLGRASPGAAQQDGGRAIGGLVEDTLGGAVAGAAVQATCGATRAQARTDAAGRFSISGLPATACEVETSADLFRPVRHRLSLEARDGFVRFVVELAGMSSEVVVTPARGEQERTFDVPEAVGVTTREELESRAATILPQSLREETGIVVQQTTTAHGSPFIRGFSAQRVVYLLDGVRFNTSTYRAGATQYLGWIDPADVQRVEIVRGPASVQYGSDALGGTIHVLSRRPETGAGGTRSSGSLEVTGATGDLSAGAHLFGLVRSRAYALRGATSTRAAGNLRTGGGIDSHSALTRYLGVPSTTLHQRLPGTGFRQSGWSAAGTLPLADGSAITAVVMQERQYGVSRYDRLLGGDGLFQSRFEPQRLDFGYLRYQRGATGPLAALQATLSFNQQQDDRLEQTRPTASVETETSRVRALGYVVEGTLRPWRGHTLTGGAEIYDEAIATSRLRTTGGQTTALRPEIPAGAGYRSLGVFLQDSASLLDNRVAMRAGVRAAGFRYDVPADAALGVSDQRVGMHAITFNTGAVWRLADPVNFTASVSRGFRAANAFDLGAIGISGGGFEVAPQVAAGLGAIIGSSDGASAVGTGRPAAPLAAESAYAFELGAKLRTRRVAASLVVFDLELRDLIARRTAIFPAGRVGTSIAGYTIVSQDAEGRAYVSMDPRPVVTRVNIERARVQGFEVDAQVRLGRAWIGSANLSSASGRDADDLPLRRMPPLLGSLRIKWEPSTHPAWVEVVVSAAGTQGRLSPGDLSDARIGGRRDRNAIASFFHGTATDLGLVRDGTLVLTGETLAQVQTRLVGAAGETYLFTKTSGFLVVGLRGGWRLSSRLDLTVILDNLADRNYRWHGSGVDAPGFSLATKIRIRL